MSGLVTLVRHSLRRRRTFLLVAYGVLFAFQLLIIAAARSLEQSGKFSALGSLLPTFMQQWAGVMVSSFRGLVLLGYTHPIVVLFLIAIATTIATECAEEAELKFVDVIMARPLARSVAINRSIVVLTVVIGAAVACMILGTRTGLALMKPESVASPALRTTLSVAAELALVIFAWGGIALAISSVSTRRASAAGASGLVAVAMFVLAILAGFWDKAAPYAHVSPFYYYHPSQVIGGAALRVSDIAVLVGFGVVGCVVAHIVYAKRDL
jgi:hypothetical protein